MNAPAVSRKTYFLTFSGLVFLTIVTTLVGFIDMGPFSTIVALLLAAAKASLIAAFFMHALYESALVRVAIAGGVVWFLILITITITDYLSRNWQQ